MTTSVRAAVLEAFPNALEPENGGVMIDRRRSIA